MKTAIFGFAGSGKSDLFAALAGPEAASGEVAMVKVPEPRLDPLARLFEPKKVTYSEIEYRDLPGGGSPDKGLGDRVLNEIRTYDCLMAVLDAFSGVTDPPVQIAAVEADFIVSDLAVIEKRLERIAMDKKKAKSLVEPKEEESLHKAQSLLESETPLRNDPELADAPELRGFGFLSAKPVLFAWNLPEGDVGSFKQPESRPGLAHIPVSARLERELSEMPEDERELFMADMGFSESTLDRAIRENYRLLGLISFLTAGEKEVRAWAVRKGSSAREAAGAIHSDIEKGFIRAEVLGWQDFLKAGTMKKAKELGLMRLEGKEYIVKDGDIIEFRFNV
jgi:hypothetical protein